MAQAKEVRARRSRNWRIVVLAFLMLILGVVALREAGVFESVFRGKPSVARGIPSFRFFQSTDSTFSATNQEPHSPTIASVNACTREVQQSQPAAAAGSMASLDTETGLKLAVVNFSKLFDAYYETKIAQVDLKVWKGDKASRDKKIRVVHDEITAKLQQVVLTYSLKNDFDIVLQSGPISSSDNPVVLYVRPELDVTIDVIALANAGHEQP